jgi:hypothetical protein
MVSLGTLIFLVDPRERSGQDARFNYSQVDLGSTHMLAAGTQYKKSQTN